MSPGCSPNKPQILINLSWFQVLFLRFWFTMYSVCVCMKVKVRRVRLFATPWTATRLLCPQNSSSKNIGVSNHSLLQGNLPNPGIELWSPAQLVAHHRLEFLERDPGWTWTWDEFLTPWGCSHLEGERERECCYVMLKEPSEMTPTLPAYWVFQNTSV